MEAIQIALESVARAIARKADREDVSEKEIAILAEASARIAEVDKMASGKNLVNDVNSYRAKFQHPGKRAIRISTPAHEKCEYEEGVEESFGAEADTDILEILSGSRIVARFVRRCRRGSGTGEKRQGARSHFLLQPRRTCEYSEQCRDRTVHCRCCDYMDKK